VICDWGRWLAVSYRLSLEYSQEFPVWRSSIQSWKEIRQCILSDSVIYFDDLKVMEDSNEYGILHGDLNLSNFFCCEEEERFLPLIGISYMKLVH
jgi:hypothetical protein